MVDRNSIISRLSSRVMSKGEFDFERLSAPPMYAFMDQVKIDRLYNIASSVRYAGNARKKYKAMDEIMKPLDFRKLSAGTNRVVYKHMECPSIVMKVAADNIGLGDNPREYINQFKLQPFVSKTFQVDQSGVIGEAERCINIRNREEFASIASDYFDLLTNFIIGKYIMADIGSHYFMNTALRPSFGIVLIDYPYLYELDGNKLYCQAHDPNSETGICGGIIDYDDGFNHLYCQKCGTRYRVKQLAKDIDNKIIKVQKGGSKMEEIKVRINGLHIGPSADMDGILPKATASYVKFVPNNDPVKTEDIKVKINNKSSETYKKEKKEENKPEQKEMQRGQAKASANNNEQMNKPQSKVMVNGNNNNVINEHHGSGDVIQNVKEVIVEKEVKIEMTYQEAKDKYGEQIVEESKVNDDLQKALADLNKAEDKVKFLQDELEREQKYSNDLKEKINSMEDKENSVDEIELLKANNQKLLDQVKYLESTCELRDNEFKDIKARHEDEINQIHAKYKDELKRLDKILESKVKKIEESNGRFILDTDFDINNGRDTTDQIDEMYTDEEDLQFSFINAAFTTLNTLRGTVGQAEFNEDLKVIVPLDYNGNTFEDQNGAKIVIYSVNNMFVDDIMNGSITNFNPEDLGYGVDEEVEVAEDDEVVNQTSFEVEEATEETTEE